MDGAPNFNGLAPASAELHEAGEHRERDAVADLQSKASGKSLQIGVARRRYSRQPRAQRRGQWRKPWGGASVHRLAASCLRLALRLQALCYRHPRAGERLLGAGVVVRSCVRRDSRGDARSAVQAEARRVASRGRGRREAGRLVLLPRGRVHCVWTSLLFEKKNRGGAERAGRERASPEARSPAALPLRTPGYSRSESLQELTR